MYVWASLRAREMDRNRRRWETRSGKRAEESFIPGTFIGVGKAVMRGSAKGMDVCLEKAAEEFKLPFDSSKGWKNEVPLGVHLGCKRHGKAKARPAFQILGRLWKLPPRGNKKMIVSQILTIVAKSTPNHRKADDAERTGALQEPGGAALWRE